VSTWVELNNIDESEIVTWAKEHCPSFCSWLVYEDDLSYIDIQATKYKFEFYNEQDAMLFLMRWQGQ
jgi:hypothetical protein